MSCGECEGASRLSGSVLFFEQGALFNPGSGICIEMSSRD